MTDQEEKEFIDKICHEYSYEHKNKICFIRIYPDQEGILLYILIIM